MTRKEEKLLECVLGNIYSLKVHPRTGPWTVEFAIWISLYTLRHTVCTMYNLI